MLIRLSKHILDEMERRRISVNEIEATLMAPDRVAADPGDPALTRSFKVIPAFDHRVLRVVHRPDDGGGVFVVTAHWDRGARPR
jgi:Domain of unknown function (DUF4258)